MARWIQDGGHGGSDPGAQAFGQKEKEWTLEAAKYVDKRLGELGIDSVMTRTSDVTLDSGPRTAKVRNSGAKYCISHHFNAGGGQGAEFIHSIYADGKFEHKLKETFSAAGMNTRRIFTRKYPGNGSKDYYFMHRETGAVRTTIVEYGFLDNKQDYNKLKVKANRIELYEAVIKAVCQEEGVSYRPVKKEEPKANKDVFYRVVTGSFNDRDGAEQRMKELEKKGFESFIAVYKK